MRLLYYYGKMQKFDSETNDFVAINFSREYEFELKDDDFFKDDNKNVMSVTIKSSDKSLPHDFWSKDGKVYNCTVFVGENGAGKSTVLQNIMRSILDIDYVVGNERLIILQDKGELFAVARKKINKTINQGGKEQQSWSEELYYSLNKSIHFDENREMTISLNKLKKESGYLKKFPYPNGKNVKDFSKVFNKTRIVYFSNTFSENDLLDNVYKYIDKPEPKEKRLDTCVRNCSRVQMLKDSVTSDNYDYEKKFQLYWSDRYKEQAKFVFSEQAVRKVKSIYEDDLKTPIPKTLTISSINIVYSETDAFNKLRMEKLQEQLLALVINPKASSEYVPYVLSVCGLLRKVNDLDKNNVEAIIKIEGILKDYKSRNSTPDQQELLKNIKDSLVDIITDGMNLSQSYIDELKAASDDKDKFLLRRISDERERDLLIALINSYGFSNFLYKSNMIKKFVLSFPISDMKDGLNNENIKLNNWKIYANTSDLGECGEEFSTFIEKYNSTLFKDREYLDFNWGLSSGEENVLDMLSCLYKISHECIADKGCIDTLVLFYDEADIGYHPEWQRKWFSIFPQMVESLFSEFKNIDIQFILATHSPLLLGDIPSRCAKYVMKTETGGIAISETINDENGEFVTFGENLYTILRNGFFLEEGTIGEIAINKSERISKAFEFFRELIKKPNSKDADRQLIIEQIEEKNDEAIKIFKKDFIEFDRKYKNEKIIVSESGESASVKCGAYLYYIDSLINQYSGFIKERLMKELNEIIQFVM